MFLHVEQVALKEGYELRTQFSDGIVKDVDLSSELYGEIFEPLRDLGFFTRVTVGQETRTIEWPNGADFAPEFLYEIGREVVAGPQKESDTICDPGPPSSRRSQLTSKRSCSVILHDDC